MKTVTIINGPNLNLLGKRETDIYGNQSFDVFLPELKRKFPSIHLEYFQSNVEGELINTIQNAGLNNSSIILNPGGYTHTSVAIGDAIAAIDAPVIEVHISNIYAREDFRKISHVSAQAKGVISGLGEEGYRLAVQWFMLQ